MKKDPPKWALQFLRWFCKEDFLEEIEGNLIEVYEQSYDQSRFKANLHFTVEVMKHFRPAFIKSLHFSPYKSSAMIKNYFKIAWRNLAKNKTYSSINIAGLAIGMAVAILIGLWIYDEVTFNKSHQNYESVAQVRRYSTDPHTHEMRGVDNMHYPMAAILRKDYHQYFKHVVMAWWLGDYAVAAGDKKIVSKGEFMDGGGIDMFSLKMLRGNYNSLNDLHSIILSASMARAFFGNEDPLNKSLKIDNRIDAIVTGVYEDIAANSKFGEVKFFAPWNLWVAANDWIQQAENNWGNSSFPIFVQLQPGVSMTKANAAISDFFFNSVPKEESEGMKEYKMHAFLYPMKDWHLYSDFKNGLPSGGRITFVWLFGIVGIFVLLLACINFINLSTARAEKRAKEVGIRKTLGSLKKQLVQQFLSESFLVVLLAFVLSLLLVIISLPWFNELADKKMMVPFLQGRFWFINIAFIVITALLAGAYPSFYLSAFQPVKVLKGTVRLGKLASLPRKALVVVQFTVSVILIIGTIVVYKQIQFAQDRPVGYNSAGLVIIPKNDPNYDGKLEVLRKELLNTGMVADMQFSSSPMTAIWNNSSDFDWVGKEPREYSFAVTNVSYGFGKMVGWQFIAGRDFSADFATDVNKIIINETAAKDMGFTNPIGQVVKSGGGTQAAEIVGVIKDVIMGSPYEPEKRAIFFLDAKYGAVSQLVVKIKPTVSANAALPAIETVFRHIVPSAIFDYKFVDEQYAAKFSQEQRVGKLSTFFAILAIFISCLGLFGLASFVAEQRTKEIGIRKVIGASVFTIWTLLSKEFIILVLVSLLIASPVAYGFMHAWVQQFTYHTNVSWWIFAVAGAGALLITLCTISWQAIKAALANPVKSLRSE
ncbi:MAG: ABC transporter permease [Chitinophagaceae bacterium]